ncbi:lipocalin family protein [Winogradskyella luteola]|uniref:Lipocalin family protein n=1 Tax=Winogradskyella luteola TaxID=2828330 RepID=A0A9X1JNP5_9FLAO|nr:lipocalin family protein [Winogradskyella luteola]MBV7267879.1 lipocalin family protein [Winogradskyella luteola]
MIKVIVIVKQVFSICYGNLSNLKKSLFILILVSFLSCSKNPETFIEHLNGYWEIEEVTLSDGTKKQYKFNETIDYIKINDSLKGFRKKLKPGVNDTYFTSDDAEALVLKIESGNLNMYYSTPYAQWKETVLEASPKHLKISNADKNVYLYKRYTPIKLDVE